MVDTARDEVEVVFGPTDAVPDRPLPRRFKVMLMVIGLVVALLAGGIYLRQRPTATERAVTRIVAAYTAAWSAHDAPAVYAVLAPGASFAAGESLEHPLLTASAGPELDRLLDSLFRASVTLETTGRIATTGTDSVRASVTQRYRYEVYGVRVVEDGVSLFTIGYVGGRLKIAQHVWWRPRAPRGPSMLWAT